MLFLREYDKHVGFNGVNNSNTNTYDLKFVKESPPGLLWQGMDFFLVGVVVVLVAWWW